MFAIRKRPRRLALKFTVRCAWKCARLRHQDGEDIVAPSASEGGEEQGGGRRSAAQFDLMHDRGISREGDLITWHWKTN